MDRRSLLRTVGTAGAIGIAGCTTDLDNFAGTTPYPEGKQGRISLADQDTVPKEHQLRITARVVEPVISHRHTARLRLTISNEGPKRSLSIGEPKCDLLNRLKARSDPPGLWLHPPGRAPERDGNRWVAPYSPDRDRGFGDYGCQARDYAKGESLRNEYLLWDDYQHQGYLEPGSYRWEVAEIEIMEPLPHSGSSDTLATFSWGFSVELKSLDP